MGEAKMIATAIEGLYGGALKDYVFPIVLSFLSAGIAAFIAYFVVKHQDNHKNEKTKIDVANKWILKFDLARENLLVTKREYYRDLDENPYFRLTAIPSNPLSGEYVSADYEELSFIVNWELISHIRAVVGNYNKLVGIWEQRHKLNDEFKEAMRKALPDNPNVGITSADMIRVYGQARTIKLIDINEIAINQTDSLLASLDELVVMFPDIARKKIDCSALRRFGPILSEKTLCCSDFRPLMQPSPVANYEIVSELFGESASIISERCRA